MPHFLETMNHRPLRDQCGHFLKVNINGKEGSDLQCLKSKFFSNTFSSSGSGLILFAVTGSDLVMISHMNAALPGSSVK